MPKVRSVLRTNGPGKSLAPVSRAFRLRVPVGFVFWLLARAQRAASGQRFGVAFSFRAFHFTLRMLGSIARRCWLGDCFPLQAWWLSSLTGLL